MYNLVGTAFVALNLLATLFAPALAQTFTTCNPLNTTNCPANPALGTKNTWTLNNATLDSSTWNLSDGTISYKNQQGLWTINSKADSPTASSSFYILWGSVSVMARAAAGKGVVSSVTMLSSDLDEIDWEWIGGNNTHVQTNYFGKGDTSSPNQRAVWVPVSNPQGTFHNYTVAWSPAQLEWLVDGKSVRVLPQGQAMDGGQKYPQTPMNVRIGLWKGGDSKSQGTSDWAGGAIDWSQAPFQMAVQSVAVNDGTPNASLYSYADKTGSYKSINITHGTSQAASKLADASPSQTVSQAYAGLSNTAKIAIAASAGGVAFLLACAWALCCIKQRRAGRRERAVEEADWERRHQELAAYRRQMQAGRFGQGPGPGGSVRSPPPAVISKF